MILSIFYFFMNSNLLKNYAFFLVSFSMAFFIIVINSKVLEGILNKFYFGVMMGSSIIFLLIGISISDNQAILFGMIENSIFPSIILIRLFFRYIFEKTQKKKKLKEKFNLIKHSLKEYSLGIL